MPDGYFDSLSSRIEAKLPPYPEAPKAEPLSRWHRIRPYVYMAAMFLGIWCMMKMFHEMTNRPLSLDAPSERVAKVMADPHHYGVYTEDTPESDYVLEMEVADSYASPADLTADLSLLH